MQSKKMQEEELKRKKEEEDFWALTKEPFWYQKLRIAERSSRASEESKPASEKGSWEVCEIDCQDIIEMTKKAQREEQEGGGRDNRGRVNNITQFRQCLSRLVTDSTHFGQK